MENLREKKERSLVVGLIALIVIIVVLALIGLFCLNRSPKLFKGRPKRHKYGFQESCPAEWSNSW